MATKIRGPADDPTRMLLGQIREVFDPTWVQSFDSGRFTVQFKDDTDASEELVAFAEMHGYELNRVSDVGWIDYQFKPADD